jgi:hypothetical protein
VQILISSELGLTESYEVDTNLDIAASIRAVQMLVLAF